MPVVKAGEKLVIGVQEIFGHNANITDNGHEIGIPIPAWYDMDMNMIINSCARGLSQIDTDIEPLRCGCFFQDIAAKT